MPFSLSVLRLSLKKLLTCGVIGPYNFLWKSIISIRKKTADASGDIVRCIDVRIFNAVYSFSHSLTLTHSHSPRTHSLSLTYSLTPYLITCTYFYSLLFTHDTRIHSHSHWLTFSHSLLLSQFLYTYTQQSIHPLTHPYSFTHIYSHTHPYSLYASFPWQMWIMCISQDCLYQLVSLGLRLFCRYLCIRCVQQVDELLFPTFTLFFFLVL